MLTKDECEQIINTIEKLKRMICTHNYGTNPVSSAEDDADEAISLLRKQHEG